VRSACSPAVAGIETLDLHPRLTDTASRVRSLKFILALTIGVIRDPRTRRLTMFYTLLVALVLLFLGATFLDAPLRQHVWIFGGYWIVCAWLTISAVLLALYDMVAIRTAARHERRRLEAEYARQKARTDDENPA
jgi:hypothetical protein